MIYEAVAKRDADQVGGARRPQLGLDPTAIVRRRLVADTHCVGDLGQSAALGQLAQDLEIAGGQIFEWMRRLSDACKYQILGDLAFEVGVTSSDPPNRLEQLLRRGVLGHIPRCPRSQRARHVDPVVMHAQNQDPRVGIGGLEAGKHLQTADAGQVQVQNDQSGL